MDRVEGVLHDLEPVARHLGVADVAGHAVYQEQVPRWQHRRRQRTQIAEEHAAHLLDWVCLQLDLVLEAVVRYLGFLVGLLYALPGLVVQPTVVGAPEAVLLGDAVDQRHAPVPAVRLDEAVGA